jgi:predicted alpha-1,6-mannanase (GH76 family)
VPWDAEAGFSLPAECWHRLRARYFGDHRWLRLPVDSLDRLLAYRAEHAYPSWEATFDALLTPATTRRNG